MGKRAAGFLLLSAFAAALAACAPDKTPKVESNVYPTRYKDEIIDILRTLFDKNETASVQNAMISDPMLRPIGNEHHYTVCVRYTAHGTIYNLTANVERIAYFYGGHLNQLVETDGKECAVSAYKPFPELNAVCLGKACK